ncbi:enoyl-CoA hydratase [Alkalicoccus daliensis]|uniref:Enoyl-CoA hydratase n=1 Tax=Alkalicoccus daliensis TaxID=745820 RepID=A0A1H0CGG7_9BACI|nr:enoyl-CoA hydratase [Alkalicoccus daliensis]SDN56998.1 enoyl-CoA hydratase [Alkalicoccus daliensis]
MTSWQHISTKVEDRIAVITLDKPPANALSRNMIVEIGEAVEGFMEDNEVKVIVMHGEGRFFAAGADIKEFTDIKHGSEFADLARDGQRIFRQIETAPKPVIAALHGAVLGGGLELAMSCHMRIACENTKLGLPELSLGLIPGFAGTQRLPKFVGKAVAMEMLLSSDPITAEEAAKHGLVNRAVAEGTHLEEAMKLAGIIRRKGSKTIQAVVELLQHAETDPIERGQEKEAVRFGDVFESSDAKEGINAFLEKRKPQFKDN